MFLTILIVSLGGESFESTFKIIIQFWLLHQSKVIASVVVCRNVLETKCILHLPQHNGERMGVPVS